jgi:hypothetical protein
VFEGTYIFVPQKQNVSPVKRWIVFLAGGMPFLRLSSKRALHWSQSSAETIAGTSDQTQSAAGFTTQLFFSPRLLV